MKASKHIKVVRKISDSLQDTSLDQSQHRSKILVTGGLGMVGSYFADQPNCVVLSHSDLDVTQPDQIQAAIRKYQPKAIVHLAALTDVDYAETHPTEAFQVNTWGTYAVAAAAQQHDIHLVYVSTGAVFYGQATRPYTVASRPNPRSVYAQSKQMGEQLVQSICQKYSIVRTGWIFGGFEKDKKFVAAIARQIWGGQTQLQAIADTYGCPTYGQDLQMAINDLIENKQYGVFHGVNKGYASRYEIARFIVRCLGQKVTVKAALAKDFPSFAAPRPKFEVMEQNLPLRHWQVALSTYLNDWQLHFEENRQDKSAKNQATRFRLALS